ncbi:P-II family nitrogen regulator [Microbacterium hydrocarbonoxydans]|uniref:P-II family nitrogen regulator n=1 Tax=Microbacterium hydrocarbonoxydans TaxID=273678 RepID=UPI003D97046C
MHHDEPRGLHGPPGAAWKSGRQGGVYRSQRVKVDFLPKIQLETIVTDEELEAALDAIQEAARTGAIGDGKIWVTDVHQVIRVRTGETGPTAIR